MSTNQVAEVSKANKYHISKHRMYELRHYVQQYPDWIALLRYSIRPSTSDPIKQVDCRGGDDPTADIVEYRDKLLRHTAIVEAAAKETDFVIGPLILKGVCEGWGYDKLSARYTVPCCKDAYYKLYRRFFWILDKKRDS